MPGPLDGVRVIEVCSAISGPFAGKLLGDMGADVVMVEDPDGGVPDRTRNLPYDRHGHPRFTWRFLNYNTSKESVALDLKTDEGAELFERLAGDADVLLENLRPGAMERLGFGEETLRADNPGLVYCSIKGYGSEGPYTDLPALDTLIQGLSGLATQIGERDRPETTNVLVIDMLTGLYAAWSIAMALFERRGSGTGQRVDVSMLDTAVSLLGHQLAEYTGGVQDPSYEPAYGQQFAPNGYFATADGYLGLLILDDHWEQFCTALDRPGWTDADHPYGTNARRLDRREELREDLEAILGELTTDEWMDHFSSLDVTVFAAPVNDIDGMVDDPQVRVQEAVVEREHDELGRHYLPAVVPKFSRTPGGHSDAPGHGEHTEAVLAALGVSDDELTDLRERGVIE